MNSPFCRGQKFSSHSLVEPCIMSIFSLSLLSHSNGIARQGSAVPLTHKSCQFADRHATVPPMDSTTNATKFFTIGRVSERPQLLKMLKLEELTCAYA